MTPPEISAVAKEIAVPGMKGLDINDSTEKRDEETVGRFGEGRRGRLSHLSSTPPPS
jgi:hypothetical protein